MKKKTIKIGLIPSDFEGNDYSFNHDCPVARATNRHFKTTTACVFPDRLIVDNSNFVIKNEFNYEDYKYVRDAYAKDKNMKKAQYFVTLIPR